MILICHPKFLRGHKKMGGGGGGGGTRVSGNPNLIKKIIFSFLSFFMP